MNAKPNVLLISVDALKPELVFEHERFGLTLKNIRSCVERGSTSRSGMKSVFPAFTYPCHQTMITGVYPERHGTVNNGIFDPTGEHKGAWHWFVSRTSANLWQLAHDAGYVSASMAFPTSVGAQGDFIAPEFWYDGTEQDSYLLDAVCRPQGLIAEMEQSIGTYPGGLDLTLGGDERRKNGALWLLEHKLAPLQDQKPFFLSCYFAAFDEGAHLHGVHSPEAMSDLEAVDGFVGEIVQKAIEIAGDNLIVCLVSDHGTLDNQYNIRPNVVMRESSLLKA